MRRIGRGLLCAMALCLAAFAAAPGAILADRWSEPPGDKQGKIAKLLTEKARNTAAVKSAEKAAAELKRFLREIRARIDELREQPTPEEIAEELKRPEEPLRDDYENDEAYYEAWDAWRAAENEWRAGLSEEDLARWNKAQEDAGELETLRSDGRYVEATAELLRKRWWRLLDVRRDHCVKKPVDGLDDEGFPIKEPEKG